MRHTPDLDSKIARIFRSSKTIKRLRHAARWTLFGSPENCGCSSVVEHLLAKEDVASSSLVTRSSPRLERRGGQRLEPRALALREGGLRRAACRYDWQANVTIDLS
jgi:hypothetical protein